ncbi:unnamed protein product, partial [Laminaria digitata]
MPLLRWNFTADTIDSKRRLFFAGAMARQNEGRLPHRVMFGTMPCGENPRPSGKSKTWQRCLVDDFGEFG